MKNITMLHYAYPPNIGGAENLMREHALVLLDLGYRVKVMAGSGEEKNKDIETVFDPKLDSIQNFDPNMQAKLIEKGEADEDFYALAAQIELELERELVDSDVIIVHNIITNDRNLALTYAFKKYALNNPNKQIIVWVHDHAYIYEERVKPNLIEIYHSQFVNDLLTTPIANARYVVVSEISKSLVLQVMKLPPAQVVVIPAGVDVKSFIGASDVLWSWCKSKEILDNFPIFFSPTNVLERKNLEYSIDVFANLKKNFPTAKYIISGKTAGHKGTTEYRLKLEQKITGLGLKDSVYFLAEELESILDYEDVKALYRLSDIVLYLSKNENFGIPILESAIFKTHIFASNLKVFKEIAGESEIDYIDFNSLSAVEVSNRITSYINGSKMLKLTSQIRKKYNLHKVLENNLVPILNERKITG